MHVVTLKLQLVLNRMFFMFFLGCKRRTQHAAHRIFSKKGPAIRVKVKTELCVRFAILVTQNWPHYKVGRINQNLKGIDKTATRIYIIFTILFLAIGPRFIRKRCPEPVLSERDVPSQLPLKIRALQ